METTGNVITSSSQNLFELQLDGTAINYLREGSKWARFIAIVGFVMCALMVLVALFAGTILASYSSMAFGDSSGIIGGGMITAIYLVFAALWFIPCLYLFRFASNMQAALNNNEQDKLITSLKFLKAHYRFIGILLIIMLCFYALAIIGGIVAAATMGLS